MIGRFVVKHLDKIYSTPIEEPLHLPAAKFEFVAQDFPGL